MNTNPIRKAVINRTASLNQVEQYLPANYSACTTADRIVISGQDNAGWTLDGYVIPRLASGLIFAEEVPAEDVVLAIRVGEDVFAVTDRIDGTPEPEIVVSEACTLCGGTYILVHAAAPYDHQYECSGCGEQYDIFTTIAERAVFL